MKLTASDGFREAHTVWCVMCMNEAAFLKLQLVWKKKKELEE